MQTNTAELRAELTALPLRMKALPVDKRGYPVPWFTAWLDGEPDFRVMDPQKWHEAVVKDLCWVCGQRLGRMMVFVLGPMCGITRTTSEPPCHHDCAVWSAKNCPFLARPKMVRRSHDEVLAMGATVAGYAIERNPGVALLWTTKQYTIFRDDEGKPLIRVGEPVNLEFFAEGRRATRAEIDESVRTGLPLLSGGQELSGEESRELAALLDRFVRLLPVS